jgi:hypothetical protein
MPLSLKHSPDEVRGVTIVSLVLSSIFMLYFCTVLPKLRAAVRAEQQQQPAASHLPRWTVKAHCVVLSALGVWRTVVVSGSSTWAFGWNWGNLGSQLRDSGEAWLQVLIFLNWALTFAAHFVAHAMRSRHPAMARRLRCTVHAWCVVGLIATWVVWWDYVVAAVNSSIAQHSTA